MGAELLVFREHWGFPVKACSLPSHAELRGSPEIGVPKGQGCLRALPGASRWTGGRKEWERNYSCTGEVIAQGVRRNIKH